MQVAQVGSKTKHFRGTKETVGLEHLDVKNVPFLECSTEPFRNTSDLFTLCSIIYVQYCTMILLCD